MTPELKSKMEKLAELELGDHYWPFVRGYEAMFKELESRRKIAEEKVSWLYSNWGTTNDEMRSLGYIVTLEALKSLKGEG